MRSRLLACLVLGLAACGPPPLTVVGNGAVTSVDRPVPGTEALTLALPGALTVQLGAPPSVRLTADENLLEYLTSEVRWGVLELGARHGVHVVPTKPLAWVLTVPRLRGITVTSAGRVTAPALVATDLALRVTSAGDIHLAGLEAATLETHITSAGDVAIDTGVVRDHRVEITSSGHVRTGGLRSATADVTITNSGSAVLWVTDALTVRLTSSGSVQYYGSPRVTAHITSSGTVTPMGAR